MQTEGEEDLHIVTSFQQGDRLGGVSDERNWASWIVLPLRTGLPLRKHVLSRKGSGFVLHGANFGSPDALPPVPLNQRRPTGGHSTSTRGLSMWTERTRIRQNLASCTRTWPVMAQRSMPLVQFCRLWQTQCASFLQRHPRTLMRKSSIETSFLKRFTGQCHELPAG